MPQFSSVRTAIARARTKLTRASPSAPLEQLDSPFFRLAGELRNRIYEQLFCREQNGGDWGMALLRVCKRAHLESLAVLLKHDAFVVLTTEAEGLEELLLNMGVDFLATKTMRIDRFLEGRHHSMVVHVDVPRSFNKIKLFATRRQYLFQQRDLEKVCVAIQWHLYSLSSRMAVPYTIINPSTGALALFAPPVNGIPPRSKLQVQIRSFAEKRLTYELESALLSPLRRCIQDGMRVTLGDTQLQFDRGSLLRQMSPSRVSATAICWTMLEATVKVKQQVDAIFRAEEHQKVYKVVKLVCRSWNSGCLANLGPAATNPADADPLARIIIILIDCIAMAVTSQLKLGDIGRAMKTYEFARTIRRFIHARRAVLAQFWHYPTAYAVLLGPVGVWRATLLELYRIKTILRCMGVKMRQSNAIVGQKIQKLQLAASANGKPHFEMDYQWLSTLWNDPTTQKQIKSGRLSPEVVLRGTSITRMSNDYTFPTEPAYVYTAPKGVKGWQIIDEV